jgi:SAM-dependent methyltransferase
VGRSGIPVDDDARWVFNRLADDYAERPGYPAALVERLLELARAPHRRIADVGAGTGHLALPLAARGARVTAVEPARAMLRALVARSGGAVEAVHATAEATTLAAASQDLAIVADALHWVSPGAAGRELGRIVVAGGAVAIVEARLADTPFLRGVQELLAAANVKARRPAPRSEAARVAQLLASAGAGPARRERFGHAEVLTAPRLDAVLRSLSLVGPALGPAALQHLLDRARSLGVDAPVWERELTLTWARVGGDERSR